MELKIKPYNKNLFPIGGILIKHTSLINWILEIQKMNMILNEISIHPIPDTSANSIWGCLVLTNKPIDVQKLRNHQLCQRVSEHFYIGEKTILHPALIHSEVESLFTKGKHIMHPEFGLLELPEALDIKALLAEPLMRSYYVIKPEPPVFIPERIRSFQIIPIAPEEVLKKMEQDIFPKRERMKDDSLNILEKTKLFFYKGLFKKSGKGKDSGVEKTGTLSKMESFFQKFSSKESKWVEKMQQDFEDLERRNKKQLDKLIDLLRDNPEEALKYAIPIDEHGSSRGGDNAQFDLTRRWGNFSLFGDNFGGGSGTINLGDGVHELRNQYRLTAEALIKEKQYQKAAFIYMKLLKDYHQAAITLETGGFYQEAAMIWLKYSNNKLKAAECYEKGKMTNEAITIYKELNMNEKVGDLYQGLNKYAEANIHYEKVVEEFKTNNQYVKAALIYKNKIRKPEAGQSLLLEGWTNDRDPSNCLSIYFSNIEDRKQLKNSITSLYKNNLTRHNSISFVRAMQTQYHKDDDLSLMIKDIAYEIIALQIPINPEAVNELKGFNKNDSMLVKDTIKFKLNRKSRK